MNTLATQQQALLHCLFPSGDASASAALAPWVMAPSERGLAAYRSNGHALAERSLAAAFPVVQMLLGADSFAALARDFWHRHPPTLGDMARWGADLVGFVQDNPQLADTPYLADVARVEWALHQAAGAADAQPDLVSLSRLGAEEPDTLTLALAPGTQVLGSRWPVATLVRVHREPDPDFTPLRARLQQGVSECALVWRQSLRPQVAECSAVEAALVQALQQPLSLLEALDAALEIHPEFDFGGWLSHAVASGLVLAAVSLNAAPGAQPHQGEHP